jgi:hypothetical protein
MTNKPYEVRLSVPGRPVERMEVFAADNLDAKAKASKAFYGHVFTGQFKYMAARLKKDN